MPSVSFVSLGCAKNLVDTEVMIAKLGAAGWRLEPDSTQADTVIINTCAFIDPAKEESTDTNLEHAQRKGTDTQLVVAAPGARGGNQLTSDRRRRRYGRIAGIVDARRRARAIARSDCSSMRSPSTSFYRV